MAPYPNYIRSDSEEQNPITYKVYQRNDRPTPWLNNNYNGTGHKDPNVKEQKTSDAKRETPQDVKQSRPLRVDDLVVVKKMPVKQMKQLQKNHGEWNPRMEESMGKEGLILRFLPEGDVVVEMSPTVQWILNQECVELSDEDASIFAVGDKARLKKLPTSKMKEIQQRRSAWVPILAEMKGRLCDIIGTVMQMVIIKLSNGYVFCVNKALLEKVDNHEQEEDEMDREYLKGDTVEIRNMDREMLTKHYKNYGLKLDSNVVKEKAHEGVVVYVTLGRIIHVRMKNSGNIVTCCPPVLERKKYSTLPTENTKNDVMVDLVIHGLIPLVETESNLSGILALMGIDFTSPHSDSPQDKREIQKAVHRYHEDMLIDFLEKQEMEETRKSKIQSKQFIPGDRVAVKEMSLIDLIFKQENHGGFIPDMNKTIGKQGFVMKVLPETGDLHVLIDGFVFLLVFNPDCIDLVERAEFHHFEVGQTYKFKNIPGEEMKKLQENHGRWVPFLEDMKGKECIVRLRLPHVLHVETLDGYIWIVNPKLIEPNAIRRPECPRERSFQAGDFVRVRKDLKRDEIRRLCLHHGIDSHFGNEIFRMKEKIGLVADVIGGRIVHIEFNTGKTAGGATGELKVLPICRPAIELVEDDQIPDIEKELYNERIDAAYCSQQRVTLVPINTAYGMMRVDACPSPKDLLLATSTGNLDATRFILRRHPLWVDVISHGGQQTALMNACASGNIDVVKELVEAGAKVDLENIDDNTPTIIAAWTGGKEILQYLLDKGSKLDKQNSKGMNAIHAAVIGGSEECLGLLLERCRPEDYKAHATNGLTPRSLAIRMKNESILKRIFSSDHFSATRKDDNGALPLHEAALYNNTFVANICLEKNYKGINEKKDDLWTPLHLAAFNNSIDVLKLLIEKGCNTDEVNEDGETPLFLAVKNCHKHVVELLLEANVDPNIPNEDGETCLHHIFKRQDLESPLLPEPIIISTPTKLQWLNLARALISKGAKTDIKDNEGKTPMDLIRDETFKAEILVLIDALDSVEKNLQDFQQKIRDMSVEDRLHRVYLTNNFAVRYFGIDGGILEIESANVRMYVPPGAIKGQEQLIYIYLDPVNTIEGKISPVVEVGPPGTSFNTKITLSYPHCAADESEWKFSTMISKKSTNSQKEWKDVDKEEDIETFISRGRVVIKTPHFTGFATKAEPRTKDMPVQKNMRIGAFGKDHKRGQTTYQFRVRTWDNYATQSVRDTEKYLESKPIDTDRPLLVRHNNEDVNVKVNDIKEGWKQRQRGNDHRLRFSDVWGNKLPSCTVDLDKTKATDDQNVYCYVRANQLKSPQKEYVDLSISPTTVSEDGNQDEGGHRDTGKGLRVLLGSFPSDLPGMSEQLYLDLCALLNVTNDAGRDWRCIADELSHDGQLKGITLVNNIVSQCTARNNDSPANFVLRHYLYDCRALSDKPLDDLKDLFMKKGLAQCLRLVEDHIRENNPQHG